MPVPGEAAAPIEKKRASVDNPRTFVAVQGLDKGDRTVNQNVLERLLSDELRECILSLQERFGKRMDELVVGRDRQRALLSDGQVAFRKETEHIRTKAWHVDSLPEALMERRVELLGGASRSNLVNGMNSGAKSYVADLWNFTPNDPWTVRRAHRDLGRAARLDLAYLDNDGGRMRINPSTTTRLMVAPRPLFILEPGLELSAQPVSAAIYDLALLVMTCGRDLLERQGGVYLYLRDVQSHAEARLWDQLMEATEEHAGLPRGTVRATVMIDTVQGALEADEILFELVHHAAGLSLDPQGYAADHIALFNGPETPVIPDRERIALNAPMLRALSLYLIAICHRRGCHAIGAPSFVLPALDTNKVKAEYLEMLADKEREAVDGHDGTLVVDAGTVTAAMMEFNKSMPKANQIDYLREQHCSPADLIQRPQGSISVESLVSMIRTGLRYLAPRVEDKGRVVQGGRLHDRSSFRLTTRLLWQWTHSSHGVITATGLDVNPDLMRYMVKKESGKIFTAGPEAYRTKPETAVARLLELVLSDTLPMEPLDAPGA